MSKTMYVEKSVEINKDVHEVFEYVKYTKNLANYSKWSMADPNQQTAQLGEDGTVGHVFSWDSQVENVGAGRQETKEIVQDQEIKYEVKFERPMKATAESCMKVDKTADGQTKVTWSFETPLDDSMAESSKDLEIEIANDIFDSLANLKNVLEA